MDAVDYLRQFWQHSNLEIYPLPKSVTFKDWFIRYVELVDTNSKRSYIVPVYDEYEDVECDNAILHLHLILQTCEYFEEAKSYEEWLLDNGFGDAEETQTNYQKLHTLVPELRKVLGTKIRAIADRDIEFNTSLAKKLRHYN